MRAIFPYVRITTALSLELPHPLTTIELDGVGDGQEGSVERLGYLHSDLPTTWLFPAIRAALADVGIDVADEFVQRGEGWLAWAELDLSQPIPDLSRVSFASYVGLSNV